MKLKASLRMGEINYKPLIKLLNQFNKSNERSYRALLNIVYSFGYKGISVIIGLAYMPLLLDYLSLEKYGVWLTLTSIVGWFSFFDIGLGNGLRNKLTISLANNDFKKGKIYVSTTYALLCVIFGVVLIAFNIANYFINWNEILNTKSIDFITLYWLTTIVFSLFIIRFIIQLISTIYFADQRPSINNLIYTLGQVISFIIVYILVKHSKNSDIILFGLVISFIPLLVLIVFTLIAFLGKYKSIGPSIHYVDFKYKNELLNLGIQFFFLQICSIIIFSTSNFFIAQFYGNGEVAIYNVAFRYFQIPIMLYSIIATPIWSAVTDAYTKNEFQWLQKTLKQLNFISIIFIILTAIMLYFSPFIYAKWMGDRIIVPFELSLALAVFTSIQILFTPYSQFINGIGRIKLSMYMTGFSMVIYFSSIYIFGHLFSNSTGIVIASISTVFAGLFIPWQIHKILNGTATGIWNK